MVERFSEVYFSRSTLVESYATVVT
jgi:hypothetical protein